MTVTNVQKDLETLTLTVSAEYDVTAERAWQLWADPRQLERWWGPPTYPATVEEHDLRAGGRVSYYMTGPEGDTPHGGWNVLEVDAPRRLSVQDYFADDSGAPLEGMPSTSMVVGIADRDGGGVLVTITSTFPSRDALEQMLAMGMEEGLREAMGQIDAMLAEAPAA
jgi:uncharacterized protein YndB with AHSA1/START domain